MLQFLPDPGCILPKSPYETQVTGGRDGCVRVWDPRVQAPVVRIEPGEGEVRLARWQSTAAGRPKRRVMVEVSDVPRVLPSSSAHP